MGQGKSAKRAGRQARKPAMILGLLAGIVSLIRKIAKRTTRRDDVGKRLDLGSNKFGSKLYASEIPPKAPKSKKLPKSKK